MNCSDSQIPRNKPLLQHAKSLEIEAKSITNQEPIRSEHSYEC